MQATSIRLPDDIGKRLNFLAKETGRSKTFYIIEAIKTHLEDLEDVYIAEQRLTDLRAGRSRIYSSEEVEALLDLED
ncbi:MAG: CopG family transcriptional regulator [Gammaproteobacteria bacterium]|nr:MAG: CopG family transcriptional regulator [Gammaproteobacteria bacterium]